MKKHILSKYAEKKAIELVLANQKKTSETRTIEESDNDYLASKRTIKTFSIENTDTDETINFSLTKKDSDSTETVESSDYANYVKAISFGERTGFTKSIENSDEDTLYCLPNNKKTLLTERIENSDPDEMIVNDKKSRRTESIENSDPDEFFL